MITRRAIVRVNKRFGSNIIPREVADQSGFAQPHEEFRRLTLKRAPSGQ